jgi:hypothetical protein
MVDGRVTGKRAVIMWNGKSGPTVLVDSASAIPSGGRSCRTASTLRGGAG